MTEPAAWAVIGPHGIDDVCLVADVAHYRASKCGGEVIPLFAKDKHFQPQAESDAGLLNAVQAFIDQTDPWLSQVADREHKVHTPEQRTARRALKELRRRFGNEPPNCTTQPR